jgi:TRAP-type C4-dicarboxylate transport system permease small subunit
MGANPAMKLKRIFDVTLEALVWVSAALLALIVLSVAMEVFLRSALNRPQAWVLELSEYGLLFITFLIAAFLVKIERNITVDIVIGLLNHKTRDFLSIVQYAIISLVAFVFVYFGASVTLDLYQRGVYNPTILQVPMAYVLFIIPVGGLFILIQSLIGLHASIRKARQKEKR